MTVAMSAALEAAKEELLLLRQKLDALHAQARALHRRFLTMHAELARSRRSGGDGHPGVPERGRELDEDIDRILAQRAALARRERELMAIVVRLVADQVWRVRRMMMA
jgi:hypothetical protein